MKILADENIHERSVALLRAAGHDVRWVIETDPSTADFDLLELANREERTLITYDTDFGELIHINLTRRIVVGYRTGPWGHSPLGGRGGETAPTFLCYRGLAGWGRYHS